MKTFRACLVAGFFVLGAVGPVRADDLRHYQQALRDQGFYYGPVDGSAGDETTQALRRYQIRNGLAVNGQLDDETRRSIDRAANESVQSTPGPLATPPPPPPTPVYRPATPTPRQNDQANSRTPRPTPPPPVAQPDGRSRVAPSAPLTNYFGGTPYEFAPPPVQTDTILRAQRVLTRSGFYDGDMDGRPNRDLAEAVSNFQEVNRLRRTGRLDTNTLSALRLLPNRQNGPAPRRSDSDDRRRDRGGVYDGRVVD